ncbi:hypothetical protein J4404_02585 [Candidatus Woesearchaeota archaeon]|nr:hypothetical protein [Candidatus Woesearchaeota archaeon]
MTIDKKNSDDKEKPSSGLTYGKYAIALVIGIGIGMLGGYFAIYYGFKPVAIYEKNLNKDNIPDIVIMNQRNDEYGFTQKADGTYEHFGLLEKKVLNKDK